MLGALGFNLLVNAVLSFVGAYVVVRGALWLFRPRPGRAELALLTLPWLKLAYDAAHGIPQSSFFWQRVSGVRQDLGSFQIGLGWSHFGPLVQLRLGALHAGKTYPQSAADLFMTALSRRWAPLPSLLVVVVLSVSAVLVARRSFGWWRHTARQRRVQSVVVAESRFGSRRVTILADAEHQGSPYASGVLRPCIVFSESHLARLSPAEREACLLHELSHIAHLDTLWAPLLDLAGDVFWFLPGARWISRRLRGVLELRADAAAVRAGASATALASALVTTAELLHAQPALGVGLVRERLLRRRVQRLLTPAAEAQPRAGFQYLPLRLVLAAVVIATVLQAIFFGNQPLG